MGPIVTEIQPRVFNAAFLFMSFFPVPFRLSQLDQPRHFADDTAGKLERVDVKKDASCLHPCG